MTRQELINRAVDIALNDFAVILAHYTPDEVREEANKLSNDELIEYITNYEG